MLKAGVLFRITILILILSLVAAGQAPASNWDNVRMIAPGTDVRVAAGNSKPIRGKLESVSDGNLVLNIAAGTQSFTRSEIRGVSVRKKGHHLRNTFIGMGVGTAAGFGIGAAAANGCNEISCVLIIGGLGGAGLVAGTVTGLVWPTGGWREVYVP